MQRNEELMALSTAALLHTAVVTCSHANVHNTEIHNNKRSSFPMSYQPASRIPVSLRKAVHKVYGNASLQNVAPGDSTEATRLRPGFRSDHLDSHLVSLRGVFASRRFYNSGKCMKFSCRPAVGSIIRSSTRSEYNKCKRRSFNFTEEVLRDQDIYHERNTRFYKIQSRKQ
mmetsp:Transcript_27350/g.93352  ORF Transcript_27350/g.93352 Transcript_27350/m.93352 type:complete len:171 (-) Transcript_27350:1904-2416(-)